MEDKYIIELTEKFKASNKKTYYVCEYMGILHDTSIKEKALLIYNIKYSASLKEFIEESYDYAAKIIKV